MPDEWMCEACGHTTSIDPGSSECPECNSAMVKVDVGDEYSKTGERDHEDFDESKVDSIPDMGDLEFDEAF